MVELTVGGGSPIKESNF